MPDVTYLWLLAPYALYWLGVWHGYTAAKEDGPGVESEAVRHINSQER